MPSSLLHVLAQREWPNALKNVCETARKNVEKHGTKDRDFFVDC